MRIRAFQLNEKAKKRILRVSSALLAILLTVFCLYHFLSDLNRGIETMLVTEDVIERSVSGNGVIFREELPIESSFRGLTVPLVSAGEHVPKDFEIATVYEGGAEYCEAYRLLTSYIDAFTEALEEEDALADLAMLRAEINTLSLRVTEMLEGGGAAEAASLFERIRILSCRIEMLTDSAFSLSQLISELSDERDTIERLAGQEKETVRSPGSGYYYPDADSFYAICSADRIGSLTAVELQAVVKTLTEEERVPCGAGTMVYSAEWYLAVEVDLSAEELSHYTVGADYPVVFSDGSDERIPMTLVRVEEGSEDNQDMLILSSLRMPQDFSFERLSRVRIITGEERGYTVPKSAVRTLGGGQGVYVLEGSEVVFCRIEIISESDSRYIVKKTDPMPDSEYTENTYRYIALYDAMILSDRPLSHGQILS